MSTIQIAGIAAATVIVVLLVIALVVTRKSGDQPQQAQDEAGHGSFLDSPPSDTLAKLGAPEPAPGASGVETMAAPEAPLGAEAAREPLTGSASVPATGAVDDGETTGEMPAVSGEPAPEAPATDEGAEAPPEPAATVQPEAPPEPAATAEPEAPASPVPPAGDRLVPLSSIIVTTSTKMVDLDDPEIRRMLTDLVTFEIDQATQFRRQGQNLDAVLQLTEAEKICRALGKEDTAREIRDMMRGLQA